MADLNDLDQIKSLDKSNLLGSIQSLGDQVKQAWEETQALLIDTHYCTGIENIVVAGMGGSGLNAHIFKSLFTKQLKVPFEIVNGYQLPEYVNDKTLVVLSSFSGSTEETIAAGKQAVERGAKITGLCSGSTLGDFLKGGGYPSYIFDPKFNPSNQPRMGLGYTIIGLTGLLIKLGFAKVEDNFSEQILNSVAAAGKDYGIESTLAKEVAQKLKDHFAIIVGSEFLTGNAHAFANQTNENAKTFSAYHLVPELNHHLLEGLTNPATLKTNVQVLLLESDSYIEKNKARYEVTKKILDKQQIPYYSLNLTGSEIEQSFRVLVFGSYVTFYLALLYDLDPTPIPWVDFFKEELKKIS